MEIKRLNHEAIPCNSFENLKKRIRTMIRNISQNFVLVEKSSVSVCSEKKDCRCLENLIQGILFLKTNKVFQHYRSKSRPAWYENYINGTPVCPARILITAISVSHFLPLSLDESTVLLSCLKTFSYLTKF